MLSSGILTIILKAKDGSVRKSKVTPGPEGNAPSAPRGRVKFEVYGEEMLEKRVSLSGNSGRIYLPPDWVGHHVKIIRID